MKPIYLDHNATTPLDQRVLDAMMPYFREDFGNASSLDHAYGHDASVAVESAREKIARTVGARHDDIVFTSGATESNNLALVGTMAKYADRGDHLITCATEHEAILETARHLESTGKRVTYLPVDDRGRVSPDDVRDTITDRTVMVSIMAANNEIGTIPNIEAIGRIIRDRGVLFHTDAAQAVGHMPIDVERMNIDLMSFSAHKMYGPKGVGALYVRGIKPRVRPDPVIRGGGQERNMRSGTLNVPGIVGFGEAAAIASRGMDSENASIKGQAKAMLDMIDDAGVGALLNGDKDNRLAGNLNIYLPGIEGKAIINSVSKSIAISAGFRVHDAKRRALARDHGPRVWRGAGTLIRQDRDRQVQRDGAGRVCSPDDNRGSEEGEDNNVHVYRRALGHAERVGRKDTKPAA